MSSSDGRLSLNLFRVRLERCEETPSLKFNALTGAVKEQTMPFAGGGLDRNELLVVEISESERLRFRTIMTN